jgi:hypothetical protein
MRTVQEIEEEVRQLPAADQKALLTKLATLVGSNGTQTAQKPLARFFAEWDASHSVSVGERPIRERTYAGNSRLR